MQKKINLYMNRKNYVVGVDLGSSTLTMAVGSIDASGLVRVETVLSKPARGIEEGVIQNVNDVSEILKSLKREAESGLGITISEAYAGISGRFIYYDTYSDHVFVGDRETGIVSQADVDALYERMHGVTGNDGEEVMDRFPLKFMIDNHREVESPVGAFSRQLSSTFALIVSRKEPLGRLHLVFRNSGLRLAGVFANSVIMPEAVLGEDEMNEGVAVIDLGGATTNIAVCQGGKVRYAAAIPLGGKIVDNDIRKHGIIRDVEKLKKECGCAFAANVPESEEIRLKGTSKVIMSRNLATIIEARLTDIIDFVRSELKDSGFYNKLPYGIVLTGGMASVPDIDVLFAHHLGCEVRIATPCYGIDEESSSRMDSTEYTSVIALLVAAAKKYPARSGADAVARKTEPEAIFVDDNTYTGADTGNGGDDFGGYASAPEKPSDNTGTGSDKESGSKEEKENKENKENKEKKENKDNGNGKREPGDSSGGLIGRLRRKWQTGTSALEKMFEDAADTPFEDSGRGSADEFYVRGNDKEEL